MCGLRDTMAALMIASMILLNWDYVDKDLYLEFLVSEPSSSRIPRRFGNVVVTCLINHPSFYRKNHAINMHKPRVYLPWSKERNFWRGMYPIDFHHYPCHNLQDDHIHLTWSIPCGKTFYMHHHLICLIPPILFHVWHWWISGLIFPCHIGIGLLLWLSFGILFLHQGGVA